MKYFAYGSNLLHQRLQARTASARPLYTAQARGYALRFHKIGDDNSGKADCFFTGQDEDRVTGLIYELDPAERPVLDAIEGVGHGYEHHQIPVWGPQGTETVFTYVVQPQFIDAAMVPFQWYKLFVQAGAIQNHFPDDVLAMIRAVPYKRDPQDQRRLQNLQILESAGDFTRALLDSDKYTIPA